MHVNWKIREKKEKEKEKKNNYRDEPQASQSINLL